MKRRLLYLALGAGLLIGLTTFWPGAGTCYYFVDVKAGMTARDVLQLLQKERLVGSPYPFLIWTRLRNAGARFKMGRYRVSQGRSAFWIVDDLVQGRTVKAKAVIPEGFASWQIAERLDELEICEADGFKRAVAGSQLEGFLFPATYEFEYGMDPSMVARKMKEVFDRHWTDEKVARAQALGWSQAQVVTLASILEREAVDKAELPLISGVYHNRLKKKIPLQADPTVQFALGVWKKRLTYEDYGHVVSPYNTYLRPGLPPGPICSPGEPATNAALWPAQTDYLYFVATDNGKHTFSTNYRDHTNKVNQRNKNKKRKNH
ncbi:MAG: endolytic transglycosylase MltG [Elusimicrobia bacterium]|nr:endolytic transglycosylase MltG [Candidatus Obscuribacterium magneticum]